MLTVAQYRKVRRNGSGSATSVSLSIREFGVYRHDLDGLRGVAIALVAVFHVWFGRVSGGVDVFLALSGFFFGGRLLRAALNPTASLALVPEVRRLVRRLLPALVVVLSASAVLTVLVQPETRWETFADQSLASLGYYQNWELATTASDYLRAGETVSPLQHIWSMSVQSYWLPIHVSVVSLGSGVFLVAGVASILFLVKTSRLGDPGREGPCAGVVLRLPHAQILDRIAYRTTIFAFPVFGFGVIFGAIWAEETWGRFWGWDPKETVSFVAWVAYAAYLHARSTAGWRDRKAAWINVAGFVAMVFNLFFINLVIAGLHSYAGVG